MACLSRIFLALAVLATPTSGVPAAVAPARPFTQTIGMPSPVTIVVSPFTTTISLIVVTETEKPSSLPTTDLLQHPSWTVITSTGLVTRTLSEEPFTPTPTSLVVVTSVVDAPETSTSTTRSPTPTPTPERPKERKKECMEDWGCCRGSCLIGSFFTFGISCVACLAIHKDLK